MGDTCHAPNCSWLSLPSLRDLKDPPPLEPNPELSGIGVILGFSITAYITVVLLLFHYVTVYDPHRVGQLGHEYTNPVDRGLLNFLRGTVITWTPSRRFEYAMEKSVLILSDTQLVTGLAILIAGYSQLDCGISSYHWQIMVYVAWFSSFTFLSAMAFLEGFFLANNNLRLIRVFFMCVLGGLQIAALLPTGSRNWLDAAREAGPLYAGLPAQCFYDQLTTDKFSKRGPRMYSMIFSVLVVGLSYIHTGIRLFDPTAEFSRKYFRAVPSSIVKKFLFSLERKATRRGIRAAFWTVPYLIIFAAYASLRAAYDIAESMLGEIIWLSFAIAWGSLKVFDTRALAWANQLEDGEIVFTNTANSDDIWSFGQILPMVLILLPVLSMFQSYLDNDAKAQDAVQPPPAVKRASVAQDGKHRQSVGLTAVSPSGTGTENEEMPASCTSTSFSIARCDHHRPSTQSHIAEECLEENENSADPNLSPKPWFYPLPRYPFHSFFDYHWYRDHIYLIVCQCLMVGCVILWVQSEIVSILGISYILRSRLFLIWIFATIPLASLIHLALWYLAASVVQHFDGAEDWLYGTGKYGGRVVEKRWWRRRLTRGVMVQYLLRFLLKGGLLAFTFLGTASVAGPENIQFGDG